MRLVLASFGDTDRGRTWRERLGADHEAARDVVIDALARGAAVDFDELDGERVRELLRVGLPARLAGTESFTADLPDLLEDFFDFAADEVGESAKKWEWLTAVGEARDAYVAALRDPDRPRVAPAPVEPHRRPSKKLGRNEPCPCGSGKKYKQCCMR